MRGTNAGRGKPLGKSAGIDAQALAAASGNFPQRVGVHARCELVAPYSSMTFACWQASCISCGQIAQATSPMWAVRRKNMQSRDWPIPPPMHSGSGPGAGVYGIGWLAGDGHRSEALAGEAPGGSGQLWHGFAMPQPPLAAILIRRRAGI